MPSLQPILTRLAIKNAFLKEFLAEFLGTTILLLVGCSAVAQRVLGDSGREEFGNFFSVNFTWGFAVCLATIFAVRGGAGHLNAAVTLGMALLGRFPWKKVPLYTMSQLLGSFCGAFLAFCNYFDKLEAYEVQRHQKSHPGRGGIINITSYKMDHTGGIFVTMSNGSVRSCLFDQILVTSLLMGGALAIIDKRHKFKIPQWAEAPICGMWVTTLISSFTLNAGAALNPSRDLGPRIMLSLCGWGREAFTHGNYFFWIPIVGPYLGVILGVFWYELLIGVHNNETSTDFMEHYSPEEKMMLKSIEKSPQVEFQPLNQSQTYFVPRSAHPSENINAMSYTSHPPPQRVQIVYDLER